MKIETAKQLEIYAKRFGLTGFTEKELTGFLTKFQFESNQVIDDVLYELSIRNESFKFTPEKEVPKPRSIREVSEERIYEKAIEEGAPSTGWPELDRLIKGFIPGHLYTITGLEGIGKTSISCNFAVNVSKQGKKVLYLALEPENTVVDYIASARTGKQFDDLTEDDILHDDGNIKIYGKEQVRTLDQLVKIVEETEDHYDLIIVDHFGYFVAGTDVFSKQSDAIKTLAGLARKKLIAIVLIAHLRKLPQGKKNYIPTSSDISGSGSFKQDSTEVLILTKTLVDPESDNPTYGNEGVLYVTKTKCGPNGVLNIYFNEKSALIESLEQKIAKKNLENYNNNSDNWLRSV